MGKQTTPSEKSEPPSSSDKNNRGAYNQQFGNGQPTFANKPNVFGSREKRPR